MAKITPEHANCPRASFFRRIGAATYDVLVAAGILIFALIFGFIVFTIMVKSGLLSDHGYEIISDTLLAVPVYKAVWQLYLTLVIVSFYAYFWSRGGQTLGMRAWRLKVQHPNGQSLSLITAYARVLWSLLGVGNVFMLLSPEKLSLQDKMTRSEVVILTKEANNMTSWKKAK
ncbi:RDD family protein [Parashewanella spongiae]|uniref:RDD family protein n=1 Tax=Parashewanella spongiae TaxID=342950 RepID=A0A3A6TZC0_9GAMM|nr:RDD family protein [Parashewanella spongiae]MCL1079801.1 RDD family protein [Parashewanella spongiae]RJY06820.1 RDD family protein [Parashewanella spongiae]